MVRVDQAADCSAGSKSAPVLANLASFVCSVKYTVAAALNTAAPDVSAFPRDPIDPSSGFSTDSTGNKITFQLATAYLDTSDQVAAQTASKAIAGSPCLGTAPIGVSCGQTFVADYGKRLFRRALTPAETTTFANYLVAEAKLTRSRRRSDDAQGHVDVAEFPLLNRARQQPAGPCRAHPCRDRADALLHDRRRAA